MVLLLSDGFVPASTMKVPAPAPSAKLPPRVNAPGRLSVPLSSPGLKVVPGPPTQLRSPPRLAGQLVQLTERSAQSATHSATFPIMSSAPHADRQLAREPVSAGSTEFVTHVIAPSSATPGSGVPAAAPCHSRFVRSRFPDSRHAWFAWNQVMHRLGRAPGMETAKTPGDGGFDPAIGVQFPLLGKLAEKS